jgi:hypothetical protein
MAGSVDGWDDVWAAYDMRPQPTGTSRLPVVPVQAVPASCRGRPSSKASWKPFRRILALFLVAITGGWLSLAAGNAAALQAAIRTNLLAQDQSLLRRDLLQPGLADLFLRLASRPEHAGVQPPRGAAPYLSALAGDMTLAWEAPEALSQVMAARMAGLRAGETLADVRLVRARGLAGAELQLGEGADVMFITIALTEFLSPRWQITGIHFGKDGAAR